MHRTEQSKPNCSVLESCNPFLHTRGAGGTQTELGCQSVTGKRVERQSTWGGRGGKEEPCCVQALHVLSCTVRRLGG